MKKPMKRYYQRAAETLLGEDVPNDVAIAIENAAAEVDRIRRDLVNLSEQLARLSTEYARDIDLAFRGANDPTRYSTVTDIARNATRLEEAQLSLMTLIRVTRGTDFATKFVAEVERLYELDRVAAGVKS